jgi:ABC-type hemin transport system ATPase subunit
MKPGLKAPGAILLNLGCNEPLPNFAFNFNLRRYTKVSGCAVAGQVTAIIGPSGAGKSTLLRALAGKIPTHGGWKRLRSSTHSLTWQTPGTVAMVGRRRLTQGNRVESARIPALETEI